MSTSSPTSSGESSRRGSTDISGGKVKRFMNGWTKEQEHLMAQWADVASCYRWLHDRSEKKYSRLSMAISIPVIILSTVTGAANFAVGSFIPPNDESTKNYVSAGLGAVSIGAGILTTLGNFFQYAQKSESNRVAGIAWGKFQRLVSVELAINPNDRLDAMDFLKICRQDLDRLIEQSPPISDDIIKMFEAEFKSTPNLKMPDICHGIEHTQIFNSSKARLAQIAADATLHLRYKKNILAKSVLPDIDRRVEEHISTRIDARIKELMTSPAPTPTTPPVDETVSSRIVGLEHNWRRLLTSRRNILEEASAEKKEIPIRFGDTRPEDIRINIVGTDGSLPKTPSGRSRAESIHSSASARTKPPFVPSGSRSIHSLPPSVISSGVSERTSPPTQQAQAQAQAQETSPPEQINIDA